MPIARLDPDQLRRQVVLVTQELHVFQDMLGNNLLLATPSATDDELSTARDADRVAVMDIGRLTELGTHDELLSAGGGYASLWRSWQGEGREQDGDPGPGVESGLPVTP